MTNVFQGIAYRTTRDYYRAIVEAFMTAGGLNNRDVILETFLHSSDEQLARECVSECSFEDPEFSTRRLIEAFTDYRKEASNVLP